MKITMICGSPRPKNSNSNYLLEELKKKLGSQNEIWMCRANDVKDDQENDLAGHISESDIVVLAYPLYVDGIPGSMLRLMCSLENVLKEKCNQCKVYIIVNNGFYEASQNQIAIDIAWKWCDHCALTKGRALSVGAGELSQMAPLGHGPSKNLGKAMEQFANDILSKKNGETIYVEPNFPRVLYQFAAHVSWKRQAKANGLQVADIRGRN